MKVKLFITFLVSFAITTVPEKKNQIYDNTINDLPLHF